MQFEIFRDFKSILPYRCLAPIGNGSYAEGVGHSKKLALKKCYSELLERKFTILAQKIKFLGIASHPYIKEAEKHAFYELAEGEILREIFLSNEVKGVQLFNIRGVRLIASKTNIGFFSMLIFRYKESYSTTHAVSKSLIGSFLKAWGEYRNIRIYQPDQERIKTYTLGNKIFGNKLKNLKVKKNFFKSYSFFRQDYIKGISKFSGQYIVYFKNKTGAKSV